MTDRPLDSDWVGRKPLAWSLVSIVLFWLPGGAARAQVAGPSTPALYDVGNGRGRSRSPTSTATGARPHLHGLATGDFDVDGWPDVAVDSSKTREVRVLRGGPRGPAAAVPVPVGTMPYFRLGVGDVIGGKHPDVLVPGHGDNTVRAVGLERGLLRSPTWNIALQGQPWMVVACDPNRDGRDDLVVVESDAISVWRAGAGGFAPAPGSPFAVRGATEAAVGDLDGDGAADVAIGPWDGDEVTVLRGGAGPARRIRVCERPIGLAIADLDGDGRGELMATCATTNRPAVTSVSADHSRVASGPQGVGE